MVAIVILVMMPESFRALIMPDTVEIAEAKPSGAVASPNSRNGAVIARSASQKMFSRADVII